MNTNKIEAFIYHKIPYLENNEIVYALSEKGKISFNAVGIKKQKSKNKANCEIGSYVKLELVEGKMKKLISSSLISSSIGLSYEALLIIQLICEYIHRLEFEKYEVLKFMYLLPKYHKLFYFLYHLCIENGIVLQVNQCVRSGKTVDIIGISIQDGGFISRQHFEVGDLLLRKNQLICFNVISRVNEVTLDQYLKMDVTYDECRIFIDFIKIHTLIESKIQKFLEGEQDNGK